MDVDLVLLSKWCLFLGISGGSIIRRICSSPFQIINKGGASEYDPTTDADIQTQAHIIGNLRREFPSVSMIGEETQEDKALPAGDKQKLPEDIDKDPYFSPSRWPADFLAAKAEDVCVFVDPVDGTKSFAKGQYDGVTVLIGVAVSGKPFFGVIHYPFRPDAANPFNINATSFAAVGHPQHHRAYHTPAKDRTDHTVVTSMSHFNNSIGKYLARLHLPKHQVIKAPGCGHKAVMVLKGLADVYVYPQAGTKKWDTCAPDAITRAHGGVMTDMLGRELVYTPEAPRNNDDGIICMMEASHISIYISAYQSSNETLSTSNAR